MALKNMAFLSSQIATDIGFLHEASLEGAGPPPVMVLFKGVPKAAQL